ncbi:hypothetical protein DF122_21150 [Burkholderia pseudomallei]|uniref:hypothetical protein n=1 Tax=Burkholderia pseudomallei TaxID=28450 RepID=UPI000F50290B|nr:hypothetical protein [Burkholderia pseudomallei]RSK62224.1 hypothetical protein DF122_21150 [Burkholderia pseudomallei]
MELYNRAKSVGNAIVEFDSFRKLHQISPAVCKNHLRGFFGDQHGDWNKANVQAEGAMLLLNAMGKQEIGFKDALKSQQQLQSADAFTSDEHDAKHV